VSDYSHANGVVSDNVLLNGARLDLIANASLAKVEGEPLRKKVRTLLLVVSDTCPRAERIVPEWLSLLSTLPTDHSAQIAVVSLVGDAKAQILCDHLRRLHLPYAMYRVPRLRRFALETGINSAPLTVVLDESSRVRRVAIGAETLLLPESRTALWEYLKAGPPGETGE
jgi:hypothetical protein